MTRVAIETLQILLRLDCETGRLFWRQRPVEFFDEGRYSAARTSAWWNTRYAETEALTAVTAKRYRGGSILGQRYLAHVVVFALYNGRWPAGVVDHEDTDQTNNRPLNLRDSTKAQNGWNRGGERNSTSRYCGVSWNAARGKWAAQCADAAGNNRHIGLFSEEEAAARAYDQAAMKWHGEFARLNFQQERVA